MGTRPEGQQKLINAAKHLAGAWQFTGDINDKLAYDKLIWLVYNFEFEQLEEIEGHYEVFETPTGSVN